jgi:hypothetical protein
MGCGGPRFGWVGANESKGADPGQFHMGSFFSVTYIEECKKKGEAMLACRGSERLRSWYAVQTRSNFEKVVHS